MEFRERILVIRLSALGDVAILAPVLRLRAAQCRDVLFLVAAPPLLEPLFRDVENIRFVPTEKRQPVWRLYRALASCRPDRVADLHRVNRVVAVDWLFRLSGVPVRAIRKRRHPGRPSWQRYNDVFDRCGLPPAAEVFRQSRQYWLPRQGAGGGYTIGIAPYARHRGKTWPLELTERLLRLLGEAGCYRVVLFGGKAEAAILEEWEVRYPHAVSLAGRVCFEEELRQMARLDLMVSMDSANMHFASCLGVPVVSLWGATHPDSGFYGWRQHPEWAVQHDMDCRPCSKYGSKPCRYGDYRCLSAISPEAVLERIEAVLGR